MATPSKGQYVLFITLLINTSSSCLGLRCDVNHVLTASFVVLGMCRSSSSPKVERIQQRHRKIMLLGVCSYR